MKSSAQLNMSNETVIPRLGSVLRATIKAAGYRSLIEDIGLDKDLDDLALEARPGVASELMQMIEDACSKELATDCGAEWAQFFRFAWFKTKESIQTLALHVDASPLPQHQGSELVFRHFTVPMLSSFMRLGFTKYPGPDSSLWLESPFQTWARFAAAKAGNTDDDLLTGLANHLDADPRTVERWLAGDPIGKIAAPYRPIIQAAIRSKKGGQVSEDDIDMMASWLMLTVAFQSLPPTTRDAVLRDFTLRSQAPWTLDEAVTAINRQGLRLGDTPARAKAISLLADVEHLFAAKPRDLEAIARKLKTLEELIRQESPGTKPAYQYIHDWFSARLAALQGQQDMALERYAASVSAAWWFGGPNQHPILDEALKYAVGVGDKVAAEHYWDKTFLLGLNTGPKRPLDQQELRRISFGFEKMFFPQKAKARIPPPLEIIVQDRDFAIGSKQLANPNQKVKFAEGRTRRTPLMDAIREGTLDDVKRLLRAGGDPNDFIKESGEGPLSYAMRRACDRKDPVIMEYVLGLELLPETVNRPASTKRETPLKITIEMGDARAVSRLIALGADIESRCDYVPSALCYAMVLLHRSLHRDDPTQELAYLLGKTPADVYDAKDGAVLDVDLASRRQALGALTYASQRNRMLFEALKDSFIRPADNYRQIIQALLHAGADANRRYRVEPHDLAEWTPTLFAAEVGDLEVFKMLIEHPGPKRGDPMLTLMPSTSLVQFDALWVAIAYGRHAIVSYLTERKNSVR